MDLLLGYGLGYLIGVPLLLAWGSLDSPESRYLWFGGAVALMTATPHYGATLLRVYEERSERRKYAIFSVWITAALVALFVTSLYDRWLGSLLLTVYVSWSPWHFSGQNYGRASQRCCPWRAWSACRHSGSPCPPWRRPSESAT